MKQDVENIINERMKQETRNNRRNDKRDSNIRGWKRNIRSRPYSGAENHRSLIAKQIHSSPFILYSFCRFEQSLAFRKQVIKSRKKTSVTDYIVLAAVKHCKISGYKFCSDWDSIYKYKSVTVGVAVAADSGLIVPVIKNAEK